MVTSEADGAQSLPHNLLLSYEMRHWNLKQIDKHYSQNAF